MAFLALFSASVWADEVDYVVTGVQEPLLTNVVNHVSAYRVGASAKLNARLRRKLIEDTKSAAANAVRPYGYFNPVISTELMPVKDGQWTLNVDIKTGPPVLITELKLELNGPGRELKSVKDWHQAFPLTEGKRLNQLAWDRAKLEVIDRLEEVGYLSAEFSRHSIYVDPIANTARLDLALNTGSQAVMGRVTFNQDVLSEGILDSLQRFEQGDAYSAWLLEKFRLDLWRSGYFKDIEVVERRELSAEPPRVNLDVNLQPRKKNTYQGTLGFGTDTQIRMQLLWGRHLLSPRGDNFDVGFGWQQKDNEFSLQSNYRLPRKTNTRQFWIASFGLKSEKQTLEVSENGDLENRFNIARGTVDDFSLRFGKTRARNIKGGMEQLFETVFAQYLHEQRNFSLTGNADMADAILIGDRANDPLLKNSSSSLAIGMDWVWPEIRGTGFETSGHHEKAWIFTSNEAWGSEIDYSQVYLSSRVNFLHGSRWKLLLRAEAGYSDVRSSVETISIGDSELNITLTDLPSLYRFKAGGSRSVRGYAFEFLDTNGLGSNHILTGSAEVEYRFLDDWSAAAFIDVGNAFDDWSSPGLKLGTGFGVRWYSVIGALRLDFAQGWDLEGDPWRIHLTIGTPLL
jgi:translocation and assembly module TamA